jgi:hypothetical protein
MTNRPTAEGKDGNSVHRRDHQSRIWSYVFLSMVLFFLLRDLPAFLRLLMLWNNPFFDSSNARFIRCSIGLIDRFPDCTLYLCTIRTNPGG